MSSKVLSLLNYKKIQKEDYPYLVILHTGELTQKKTFALSPQAMEFGPYCLIYDLHPTLSYWQQQAQAQEQTLEEALQKELRSCWGTDFLAVLCIHPFQGLLLAHHLDQSQTRGLMTSESFFTKKIFKNISWKTWFSTADHFFNFCQDNQSLLKESQSYTRAKNRLAKLVQRLQLAGPFELSEAHWSSVQRRFEGFLGKLWRWTFLSPSDSKNKNAQNLNFFQDISSLEGFPWCPIQIQEKPARVQILEAPLSTWEQISPHLHKNLEALGQNIMLQSSVKILRLDWEVTLFDLESYTVSIPFTFPYSLQHDAQQDFKVSLSQMAFAFQKFQEQVRKPSEELELVAEQLLIGWKLEVSQFIHPREDNVSLLTTPNQNSPSLEMIQELQNKIPAPLTAFEIKQTHIPNFDYDEGPLTAAPSDELHPITPNLPLPFFIHPQPLPVEKSAFRTTRFIERTSADWWLRDDIQDAHRDYFICETHDRKLIWAFKNYKEEWFEHGLFS